MSVRTVRWIYGWLKTAFNFVLNEKLISENPASKVKLPPLDKSAATPFTLEEAVAFVSVKDSFWYGNAFVFQLHTGLRPEELLALVWNDIDFKKGTVRIERACKWIDNKLIEFGPLKSKRGYRTIELSEEILDLLKEHHEKQLRIIEECKQACRPYGERMMEEWLSKERSKQKYLYPNPKLFFPSYNGTVQDMNSPRRCFKAMLRCAGFKGDRLKIRWYDLRHTHATVLRYCQVLSPATISAGET